MKSGLFLDVVIRKGMTIFQLLSCEDQTLLVRWNSFLVLNLCLYVIDGVAGFDVQGDGLAGQSLHKDLHASTKAKDKMKSGLFLDVVIRQGTTIFQLLSCEDQTLLVRWNSFLV